MSRSIQLYRALIAAADEISVGPVQRKLKYNIRELFDLYKPVKSPDQIAQLHKDAEAAIQVIQWFKHLPEVVAIYAIARKPTAQNVLLFAYCTRMLTFSASDGVMTHHASNAGRLSEAIFIVHSQAVLTHGHNADTQGAYRPLPGQNCRRCIWEKIWQAQDRCQGQ